MELKGVIHGQLQAEGGRSSRGPAFQVDQFRFPSAARIESRPSVSAAGPRCRISADLISTMRSLRTARRDCMPARSLPDSSDKKFSAAPRCENNVGRGSDHVIRRDDSASLAAFCFLSLGNTSLPPASE